MDRFDIDEELSEEERRAIRTALFDFLALQGFEDQFEDEKEQDVEEGK